MNLNIFILILKIVALYIISFIILRDTNFIVDAIAQIQSYYNLIYLIFGGRLFLANCISIIMNILGLGPIPCPHIFIA